MLSPSSVYSPLLLYLFPPPTVLLYLAALTWQGVCALAAHKVVAGERRKWARDPAPRKRLLVEVRNVLNAGAMGGGGGGGRVVAAQTQCIGWASIDLFRAAADAASSPGGGSGGGGGGGGVLRLCTSPLKVGLRPPPADPTDFGAAAWGAARAGQPSLFLRLTHGADVNAGLKVLTHLLTD